MSIKETLGTQLKDAMRNKDASKRTVIRTLMSAIKNAEIDSQSELDDDGIIIVFTKQAQQRKDSIEAYQKAERQDLVDNEKAELDFISQFLPAQMSEEEIQKLVDKVINELNATNPSDMGKVMGKLMPQIKGKADGKLVNSIVSSKLK
ncbi:MAG: GatB/YqeY domain-containing protein [SAR202 cluster bacterium]|nr:GatB/YqeY domain-containing protein [SAR202 cluster bacterium]|tara:strand:+ start:1538 stop:1981 length:444 start_codon:yes stop_codon:yes gene_type:complete